MIGPGYASKGETRDTEKKEILRYHMDQNGLQPCDLIPLVGGILPESLIKACFAKRR